MKRKINEIFHSLQGEGAHTGIPSVFVRFSGCNMRCSFCDTDHFSGTLMEDEDIFRAVSRYPAEWVILTGGEPSLWIDNEFVENLKKATGKMVAIETNGSREVPESVDWVAVSPKNGMDGAGDYELKVRHADELKVVDVGQDLEPYLSLPCISEDTVLFLQPCFVENPQQCAENRMRTVRRVMKSTRWRLSVQLHRYLDIP